MIDRSHYTPPAWSWRELEALARAQAQGAEVPSPYDAAGRREFVQRWASLPSAP